MGTTIITALLLLGITVLMVCRRVRGASAACGGRRACPRCGAEVPGSVTLCPECNVPQQVYEIASAPLAKEKPRDVEERGVDRLHAVVRADVCAGCGSCVPACPEPGAIRMEGKIAVVDKDRCAGHGACAEACPMGGIVLSSGEAVHHVEVPSVRADFQTNVQGVYIVGELGGRGLIKNAINEGKIATENVAREIVREGSSRSRDVLDLVIVGSGPAGLSAGLEAKRHGLRYVMLEQGTLADSIRKYPRHKLLLAEPVGISLFGDLWVADASKETLLQVWESIVSRADLPIRTGRRVDDVREDGDSHRVVGEGFEIRARFVILANGRRGTPRRLGVPGEGSAKVFYDIVEMATFRGRRVLVVGGGDSALESAVGLANQDGTTVALSYRRSTFERAKDRNVAKLEEAERTGKVRVLRGSRVTRIDADAVTLTGPDGSVTLPNDDVIVRIGGVPPTAFLERVGVRTVKKELPLVEAREAVGA